MWFFGLIYPFNLYQARNFYETQLIMFLVICSAVSLFVMTVLSFLVWKNKASFLKDKIFFLGIIWFIVTLAPIMGGQPHRWYLYLSGISLSFIIIAVWRSLCKEKKYVFYAFLSIYLVFCSIELNKQTLIWSVQSDITQNFLAQVEKSGLHKLDAFHFSNMPFGYKSAFLFTFSALEKAIFLNFGTTPEIKILSYLNIGDDNKLTLIKKPGKLLFRLNQDIYAFFLFPPSKRTFSSPVTFGINNYEIKINQLTPSHTVGEYEISIPPQLLAPFYYFDGKKILPL